MDAADEMTSQQKLKSGSTRGWNIPDEPPIAWRDALETVINSRKLSDALGNPSTQRKCIYAQSGRLRYTSSDKNNTTHFWKIKEKKHIL